MTSSPPSTIPQFRGKTLTPESPRPLHIPEPSNIPILERQIDPIFNLMSTHLKSPHALRDLTAMDHQLSYDPNVQQKPDAIMAIGEVMDGSNRQNVRNEDKNTISLGKEDDYVYEDPSNTYQPSMIAHEHSASMASFPYMTQTHQQASASTLQSGSPAQHAQDPFPATTPVAKDRSVDPKSGYDGNLDEDIREDVANGGVNYQTLLDNISPSNAFAAERPISATSPTDTSNLPKGNASFNPPPPLSLPPRPPPQEKPAIHPNYMPGEDIRSYHFPQMHHTSAAQTNPQSLQNNTYPPSQGYPPPIVAAGAPGTSSAPNGLPPPPMATFQQSSMKQDSGQNGSSSQQFLSRGTAGTNVNDPAPLAEGVSDSHWPPEIERQYDDFLKKERIYVSEGLWDRFPAGSRLFVGNLPTESVSKRELFQTFHKYGELAQISIKQAYGFVQYHDAKACYRALQGEQGLRIKDRNMHLEISKPQKNSRNAAATADGDRLRANYGGRRSRSPEYGRGPLPRGTGQRFSGDRYVGSVPFSDFRDEPRRRDDYRPMRSPSPRGFRGRDEFRGTRDRSPNRFYGGRRSRSRSPYGKVPGRYRSPSPRRREFDEDASLPMPRRNPRDVPDVQLILVEELDRAFVAYIEKSFRDRSLRCEVMLLPRVPLAAVVNRQILEGVPAIVKLYRSAQVTGKIPLQVFDRSRGPEDVRFDEYEDLDAHVAAEIVIRGKTSTQQHDHPGSNYTSSHYTPYNQPPQQQPQLPQQQQRSAPTAQPSFANMITSLDGPSLQKLLGAMQQSPQLPQTPQQHVPQHHLQQVAPSQTQGLAALLGNATRQQGSHNQALPSQGFSYPPSNSQQPPPQQYPYGAPGPNHNFVRGGNSHQSTQQPVPAHYQQQPQGQQQSQQVQNIMEQLAKWKQ